MNERIKELAKGAKEYASSFAYAQAIGQPGYQEKFSEKFAELLIRECVAICQDIDGEDSQDGRCARQDCAVEIREHFGVEE